MCIAWWKAAAASSAASISRTVKAVGYSDADVLAHAPADAILGACRGGDIGKLFPDTASR